MLLYVMRWDFCGEDLSLIRHSLHIYTHKLSKQWIYIVYLIRKYFSGWMYYVCMKVHITNWKEIDIPTQKQTCFSMIQEYVLQMFRLILALFLSHVYQDIFLLFRLWDICGEQTQNNLGLCSKNTHLPMSMAFHTWQTKTLLSNSSNCSLIPISISTPSSYFVES